VPLQIGSWCGPNEFKIFNCRILLKVVGSNWKILSPDKKGSHPQGSDTEIIAKFRLLIIKSQTRALFFVAVGYWSRIHTKTFLLFFRLDYVYFETSSTTPFQIRRIEELNKVSLWFVIFTPAEFELNKLNWHTNKLQKFSNDLHAFCTGWLQAQYWDTLYNFWVGLKRKFYKLW
jgi:hypothetical protein